MEATRRQHYLQALGIDVWLTRQLREDLEAEAESPVGTEPVFFIGPGESNLLLLCGSPAEAALPIAADIARSLDCEPVWAWPVETEAPGGLLLGQAIEERLFTRVVAFGANLAPASSETSDGVLGSARILRSDPIPGLLDSPAARRALWGKLCALQWSCRSAGS